MKKILLCLIYFFTTINLGYTQIGKAVLEQSKNYLNNKITFLMIEEYVKSAPKSQNNFISITPFFANLKVENAKRYSTLYDTLKTKFPTVIQKLSAPINKIGIDKLVSLSKEAAINSLVDSSFAILNKEYNGIYNIIKGNKEILISELFQYFDKNVKTEDKVATSDPLKADINSESFNNPQPKESEEPGFFSFSNFSFWSLLPLLICLALFILIINLVLKLGDRIEKRKEEIEKLNFSKPVENYQSRNTQINLKDFEKMITNSDTIQRLSQEISELKKSLEVKKSDNYNFVAPVPQYIREGTPSNETFYMAGPVNNYFPNTAKSQTKENTVYKFTVKPNNQEASYEIHTLGAPINEILSMVESYIKPACDEENIPGGNVRNIITKKQGSAILEGEKWIIKTKAVIRYE